MTAGGRPRWPAGGFGAQAQRELLLALLLLMCYGFFRQVPAWNENSRYDLVLALVDDHSTRIDPYEANTGDKALRDGHYYSDKPPGSSLLGVPVYAVMRGAAILSGADRPEHGPTMQALAFGVAGLPTVLTVVLLLRLLRTLVGEWWAFMLSVAYGLGTIAFPFATMYFGHAAATFFLFAAYYMARRIRSGTGVEVPLLAGFLAGWAVLVDFGAALGVGLLLLYAFARERRAPFLLAVGALPPALLLLAYNWVSFGSPFSTGYANLANQGFLEGMSRGALGVTLPRPEVLAEILSGPRGLLRLSPWLAVAPLGLLAARRPGLRGDVLLCAGIVLGFLLANAGYYLPLGGWTPGPRFLTPALPFATVLVAFVPALPRLPSILLIAESVAYAGIATATMPNAPEIVGEPLVDLWLPRLRDGYLAESTAWLYWGLAGLQPLIVLGVAAAIGALTLWCTSRSDGRARRAVPPGLTALGVLVLGFGTPLDIANLVPGRDHEPTEVDLSIWASGVSRPATERSSPARMPWAQIENRGAPLPATRTTFTIYGPSGQSVWSGISANPGWRSDERRRLTVEWSGEAAAPGEYRVGLEVRSGEGTLLARSDDAGHFTVDR